MEKDGFEKRGECEIVWIKEKMMMMRNVEK